VLTLAVLVLLAAHTTFLPTEGNMIMAVASPFAIVR
jgi:hypothetical protein